MEKKESVEGEVIAGFPNSDAYGCFDQGDEPFSATLGNQKGLSG